MTTPRRLLLFTPGSWLLLVAVAVAVFAATADFRATADGASEAHGAPHEASLQWHGLAPDQAPSAVAAPEFPRAAAVPTAPQAELRIAQAPAAPAAAPTPLPTVEAPTPPPASSVRVRLTNLSPEALHARLQSAFDQPLPVLSAPEDQWFRFSVELPGEAPVLAAIDRQTGEMRLDGRAEQLAAWQRIVQAIDAPPLGQNDAAYVAVTPQAAPQVRQTVAMLVAQSNSGSADSSAATTGEPAAGAQALARQFERHQR